MSANVGSTARSLDVGPVKSPENTSFFRPMWNIARGLSNARGRKRTPRDSLGGETRNALEAIGSSEASTAIGGRQVTSPRSVNNRTPWSAWPQGRRFTDASKMLRASDRTTFFDRLGDGGSLRGRSHFCMGEKKGIQIELQTRTSPSRNVSIVG